MPTTPTTPTTPSYDLWFPLPNDAGEFALVADCLMVKLKWSETADDDARRAALSSFGYEIAVVKQKHADGSQQVVLVRGITDDASKAAIVE